MALWAVHGNSRCLARDAVVSAEERLSWPLTMGLGLQHVAVMFGSTMLVPLLTGLPVSTTLLFSGIGTLLFLLLTRNRVPGYLGASAAFVVPLNTAVQQQNADPSALVGGIMVVGVVLLAVGVAVKALGVRLLETALPPVVTGVIVLMIGVSLAPRAVSTFDSDPVPGGLTSAIVILLLVLGRGLSRRVAVLAGVLGGWLYAAVTGNVAEQRLAELATAPWLGLPQVVEPRLHLTVLPLLLPLAIVLLAEHVAHIKAVAATSDRDLDPHMGDALIGGGLATTLSGAAGGTALGNYAPNVGLMAATRVYSTASCLVAAVCAIVLAFSPKLVALLNTVPLGVVGGATLVLFGMIAMIGVRILADSHVDLRDPVNLTVLGTALLIATGNLTLTLGELRVPGMAWGSVGIVLVYPILRKLADLRGSAADRPAQRPAE